MAGVLTGKSALVTGASTGIGRKGAELFASNGARVVIADINDVEGEKTVAGIQSRGGRATYLHVDLRQVDSIKRMVSDTIAAYNALDIFWHNAGGSAGGHIDLTTEAEFDLQIAVNLKAAVFGVQAALPELRRSKGCVLFTSSMVGIRPTAYQPSYSLTYGLTKAGLVMLVRCLTEPLAKDGVRVNCLCPGPVPTERVVSLREKRARVEGVSMDEYVKDSTARIPLGREVATEEIAEAALFLCSDKAAAITGVALPIDGGFTAL